MGSNTRVTWHAEYAPDGWFGIFRSDAASAVVSWTRRTDLTHAIQTVILWSWEHPATGFKVDKVWKLRDDGRYVTAVTPVRISFEEIQ
ncbi:hypothetical protein AB0I84_07385 [Streptomyces spectabilis]|uniref:hypothetical protein n=1 Tax=Streptomyces spectabilis TaxID=68270 RepID=UPI0034064826